MCVVGHEMRVFTHLLHSDSHSDHVCYVCKVSWGSKKHISIKNVQEIENFASAYLNTQTSYDFQTWIFFP